MSGFAPLELQILSINVLGLAGSTLNWSWLKWDRQLEKISNFTVSQSDELDVKDVDWLKTILSWIVVARFIIDRVSLLAYVANIYTIVTRSRQNLLVLWMVLSFFKDIILEVIVIVITFLLWRKGNVSTSLLVEFIAEKTLCLVISVCKWCTTFKWYMQLRRMAKIRRFAIIARRSIASIINIPGRVGHSLDDECLGIAIIRRGKYVSLLNLDRLSEELSSRANAKSLTTLATEDTNGANDYNSDVNDLSVAEKSMRILNVTAEDVMDARARIQERSYWDERDVTAKTPEVIEEVVTQSPLEKKNEEETIDASRNKQTEKNDLEQIADHVSVDDHPKSTESHDTYIRKEDSMGYSSVKKEDKNEVILVDGKEQILTRNQEDILKEVKSNNVTFDKVDNHAKSTESRETYIRKEDSMGYSSAKKEEKEDKNEVILVDGKEQILTINQEDILEDMVKSNNVTFDKVDNHAKSTESRETIYVTPKKRGTEKEEGVAKIVQCPSFRSNARNLEAKPCASLVRKLETKLYSIPIKRKEKGIDRIDRRRHPCQVNTQLMPSSSGADRKECYKSSKISCACHRALRNSSKNGRSSDGKNGRSIDGKNVEYDINGKEFNFSVSIVNMQRSRLDKSAFKYSEAYRLKKQIRKWEEFRKEQHWDSKSLAQTAHPSGYARNVIDASDKLSIVNCRKSIRTGTRDESMMLSDSVSERCGLKHDQVRGGRSADLRSAYNVASFREKNYAEAHEKMRALEICNNLTPKNREAKTRKRYDLLPASRNLTIEEREAIELRALRAYNELTLSEDKRELEVRRDSSLSHGLLTKDASEAKVLKIDPTLPENKETKRLGGRNWSSPRQSINERSDSSRDEVLECEEETPPSVFNRLSMDRYKNITIPIDRNRGSSLNADRCARQAHTSLNLMEITRNIERTIHPRGIILANKNLHGRPLENARFREGQQRDIVDDNTASTLHSAFFFKPEIVTRVFRRAQTRIGESLSSLPTSRREDLDTDFACRMNNETVARNWDSSFDLERLLQGNDRHVLEDSARPNASEGHAVGGHDLCIIFIGREQMPSESETVIIEDSATVPGSRENARSSTESARTTSILILDEDMGNDRLGSAINDNLPVRLITSVLRNFDIAMPQGSVRDIALLNEEYEEYVSNLNNNIRSQESNTDAKNLEENNNECGGISSHNNANVDDTIHGTEQTLNSSDNGPDNTNVTADDKYLSTIDIHSEDKICENNLSFNDTYNNTMFQSDDENNNNKQFDTLDNKTEKSMFNYISKSSSELSFPGPSSFIESDNRRALRPCDEKLQKSIQLSNSAATSNDQRNKSISNLNLTTNCDTIPQFRHVETLRLGTTMRESRNENRDVYEEANDLAEKLFKMHSDDELQQDDSFYFTYGRNDDPGTPISLEDGSLMEEFLNDPISPFNSSYS